MSLREADHGRLLAEWLRRKGLLFIHVPNEGERSVALNTDLIRQGLTPGACDYLVFKPVRYLFGSEFEPPAIRFVGTAIELKRVGWKPRNKADKARLILQQEFLAQLESVGWAAKICYGWEDAVKFLQELGY